VSRPDASVHVEAGIRAFIRGDRGEAERCWRAALELDPSDARAREYLASLAGEIAAAARAAPAPPAPVADGWDEQPAAGARIDLPAEGGIDLSELTPDQAPLVGAPAPPPTAAPPEAALVAEDLRQARDAFALGDFSGSLACIERVLALDPTNAEALAYLHENEATLVAMYESRLGPLDAAPRVKLKPEELLWLNLDHRAGFLLAQVDGSTTWEDLFSVCGLPRLEAARILARLVDDGVVAAG
jgi:tetratricopeptide (TPR) repeat protein